MLKVFTHMGCVVVTPSRVVVDKLVISVDKLLATVDSTFSEEASF